MELFIGILIGAVAGFAVGWLLAGKRAAEQRAALETQIARLTAELDAARRAVEEKSQVLGDAQKRFEETFKALAGDTLRANSESFLAAARSRLETLMAQADGGMEKRREAIEKLLAPVGEALRKYEEHLRLIEREREGAYASLRQQVAALTQEQQRLQRETANLVTALRLPQVRGRWGEMTLRRAAELAGMVARCDFTEQVTLPDGRLRPDMIVHLPGGRQVVVDAKVSLAAYLTAIEADDEDERQRGLAEHARQVREHMMRLASKEYAKQLDRAPDFTVLFLPGESFFSAAVRNDSALLEDSLRRGVILAAPTTFIALLWAVAHGWRQVEIEENARKITEEGRELYERTRVLLEHFLSIGPALGKAVDKYNDAVGSLSARFLPSARRLKDLAAATQKDLPEAAPIESAPRPPSDADGGESNGRR